MSTVTLRDALDDLEHSLAGARAGTHGPARSGGRLYAEEEDDEDLVGEDDLGFDDIDEEDDDDLEEIDGDLEADDDLEDADEDTDDEP